MSNFSTLFNVGDLRSDLLAERRGRQTGWCADEQFVLKEGAHPRECVARGRLGERQLVGCCSDRARTINGREHTQKIVIQLAEIHEQHYTAASAI